LNKMDKQEKEYKKSELIADLLATQTVMEEMWRYHPENPDKKDVTQEYNVLKQMCSDIEKELSDLDK
tara:strand:- start:2421 stop:2621 length:201 start_codon:yes stop_codon:yes gene_type:complete